MSKYGGKIDDPRRSVLLGMLASGIYVVGNPLRPFGDLRAQLLGKAPKLAAGRSIFSMRGQVTVNGQAATMDTFVSARDIIETGAKSYIIFVVGKDAFILRSNGSLQLEPDEGPAVSKKVTPFSTAVSRTFSAVESSTSPQSAPICQVPSPTSETR